MNILVFGAGAIGCALGGFLSKTGHKVVLFGRADHLKKVARNGLRVSGIFGSHTFRDLTVYTNLKSLRVHEPPFDLVLFTVKTFDSAKAATELKTVVGRNTFILSLQNGLGNIEVLHRYFPKKEVLAARIIFGVVKAPGEIKITVWGGDILIGETISNRITARIKRLAHLFTKAGLKARAVKDIRQAIWGKVMYNSALNPLASLLETHYGSLLEYEETRNLMKRIIHEAYEAAKKAKIRLNPPTAESYIRLLFEKLIPDTYDHHPSMLFDLKKGRTEIDSMNGAIVRIAKRYGLKVPVNQAIVELIKSKNE